MPSQRRRRLKELEQVIGSGFTQVVELGLALREIRDDNLQWELAEGLTFEEYYRTRWGFVASTARRYIDAAEIHEAIAPVGANTPINSERVARELAPLLRAGGKPLVAEAWSRIAERYENQRPPTGPEVHRVLIEEGYREPNFGPSSGRVNRRVRLGQFGDKLIAAEKRLNWFATKELGDKPLVKKDQDLAASYADKCEAMAALLRSLAAGEVPD